MAAKGILRASNAVMLLCDMQTKFVNHIQYFRDIAQASKRLLDASAILEVPVIASEHVSSCEYSCEAWNKGFLAFASMCLWMLTLVQTFTRSPWGHHPRAGDWKPEKCERV
eukprot:m.47431 g.47431  ORF g.47431 m.47431 type:complete len:111 (-) comp11272_c1_seq2:395-727(-)